MGAKQQGQTAIIAFKKQSGLGVPAVGGGGTGLEVRASAGLALQVAAIESAMFRRNRMKLRPRQGSKTATAAYTTELQVGNLDGIFAGVLGTNGATVSFSLGNADVTNMTISGGGILLTGGSGSFLTLGVRAGMMGKFTNMSVAGNNGVWFPITNVTALTMAVPTGYLADNALDAAFTLTIAKSFSTPTPYVEQYYTFEEHLQDIAAPLSKYGTDMKFSNMQVTMNPSGPIEVGFGLTGLDMTAPVGGAILTAPTYNPQVTPSSLVCLDGAILKNGVVIADLTGCTFGLAAPITLIPVLGSRKSPDAFLGQFAMTGNFTELLEDGGAVTNFTAEDTISWFMICVERDVASPDFVSFYMGNCSFGGWTAPISDGAMTQTMTLFAGSDNRGAGFNDTTLLVSTSAA
jgi:hypothetical protein